MLRANVVPMVNAEQQHFENKDPLRRINHAVAGSLNTCLKLNVKDKRETFSPELCVLGAAVPSMSGTDASEATGPS